MGTPISGDVAVVTVTVDAEPDVAFDLFTAQIDQWWRRGPRYRNAPGGGGTLYLECKPEGRLFESFPGAGGETLIEIGRIVTWSPPSQLVFRWRNRNFAPHEFTRVEITFEPCPNGTQLTVRHSGLASLRPDHPARHGLAPPAYVRMMGLWWADQLTSLRERAN
jgi:uncharacterized protein YndB with AHSA1/START domain